LKQQVRESGENEAAANKRGEGAKPEETKQKLAEADGFYDSGRYDLAFKRAEQVLNVDPSNIEARKLQEKINRQKDDYASAAGVESRSRATWKTDQAWANPTKKF
jgi:general secretion pathway protein D